MKNNICIIIVLAFTLNLLSCKKHDTKDNRLIGTWQSIKVDSLIHYIIPIRDSAFHSVNFQNNILEIKSNGSFQFITAKDTIFGSWNQFRKDSLMLTNNNKYGEHLLDSKIEFIDNNNLTLSYNYGYVEEYLDFNDSTHITLNTLNDIKFYYRRK